MPITDRNLGAGTKLVATYKKALVRCEVVESDERLSYQLADGRLFKSPSAAGSAAMGGVSCNGWRFWSVEGDMVPGGEPKLKAAKAKKNVVLKQIRRVPNQKGVPDGMTKYHCAACMDSFISELSDPPECPQGHLKESADDLGAL